MTNKVTTRHEPGASGSYLFPQFLQHIDKNLIKTIFEAGSRDLLDAICLRNFYSGSTVYAFECNPEGIEVCKQNLQNEKNIVFTDMGLSDIVGEKTFYSFNSDATKHHNHGVSSFYKHKEEDWVPQKSVTVQCTTVDTFCLKNNIEEIDMLCFDMQGGEYDALKGAQKILPTVRYIILENDGHAYQNTPNFDKIEKLLSENNFILAEKFVGDYLFINTKRAPLSKHLFITGNTFKKISEDFLDEEKTYIDMSKKPKIIFLKTDWIELFKSKILPKIDYKFKLITHNGDRPCPSENFDLLEDDRLIAWYGMNCHLKHPKLQPIPIGIANEKWPHGDKNILHDVVTAKILKTGLCYSNFDITTNPKRRPEIYNIIKQKGFVDVETHKLNFREYLTKLKSYKYVISPPGNSIDCHRIWESIYVGTIPIVERHVAMDFFKELPILFVDNFSEITEELLQNSYNSIIKQSLEKSNLTYYKKEITNFNI